MYSKVYDLMGQPVRLGDQIVYSSLDDDGVPELKVGVLQNILEPEVLVVGYDLLEKVAPYQIVKVEM